MHSKFEPQWDYFSNLSRENAHRLEARNKYVIIIIYYYNADMIPVFCRCCITWWTECRYDTGVFYGAVVSLGGQSVDMIPV